MEGDIGEINCVNCEADCCRAKNRYQLYPNEAESMGMDSNNIVIYSMDLMDERPDTYESTEDCKNLTHDPDASKDTPKYQCSLHGTDQKPGCCRSVQPGGAYCLHARKHRGYIDSIPTTNPLAPTIIPLSEIS